jgi:hypothetical protein
LAEDSVVACAEKRGVLVYGTVKLYDDPEWVIRLEEAMLARYSLTQLSMDLAAWPQNGRSS